jgi:hypothetical protein
MLNFAMALHHPSVLQFALLWFIKSIEKGWMFDEHSCVLILSICTF